MEKKESFILSESINIEFDEGIFNRHLLLSINQRPDVNITSINEIEILSTKVINHKNGDREYKVHWKEK